MSNFLLHTHLLYLVTTFGNVWRRGHDICVASYPCQEIKASGDPRSSSSRASLAHAYLDSPVDKRALVTEILQYIAVTTPSRYLVMEPSLNCSSHIISSCVTSWRRARIWLISLASHLSRDKHHGFLYVASLDISGYLLLPYREKPPLKIPLKLQLKGTPITPQRFVTVNLIRIQHSAVVKLRLKIDYINVGCKIAARQRPLSAVAPKDAPTPKTLKANANNRTSSKLAPLVGDATQITWPQRFSKYIPSSTGIQRRS